MPIFEYKCAACGLEFEKLVFGNTGVSCPECTSDNVVKKFSTFGMSGVGNRPPQDAQVVVPAPAVPASNKKKLRRITVDLRISILANYRYIIIGE